MKVFVVVSFALITESLTIKGFQVLINVYFILKSLLMHTNTQRT